MSDAMQTAGLAGHVALVTGGVRGIGLGISERLVAAGVRVAAGYSRPSEASESFLAAHSPARARRSTRATSAGTRTASASSAR